MLVLILEHTLVHQHVLERQREHTHAQPLEQAHTLVHQHVLERQREHMFVLQHVPQLVLALWR